ncbi:hypothetical protein BDY19DRAFT_592804 [Irpex rosettiformis]|uniref:Uncharacterized protein n=1 Tax=Irpex rosettiformis TaxID=378272 RepID=A0ACB8UDK0_9APHY|nr:hypothetical protein BDY19DRAFT_592804 [Irpex rosettiformis]
MDSRPAARRGRRRDSLRGGGDLLGRWATNTKLVLFVVGRKQHATGKATDNEEFESEVPGSVSVSAAARKELPYWGCLRLCKHIASNKYFGGCGVPIVCDSCHVLQVANGLLLREWELGQNTPFQLCHGQLYNERVESPDYADGSQAGAHDGWAFLFWQREIIIREGT